MERYPLFSKMVSLKKSVKNLRAKQYCSRRQIPWRQGPPRHCNTKMLDVEEDTALEQFSHWSRIM